VAERSCDSSTRRTRGWPRRRWSGSPTRYELLDVAIHHRVGAVEVGQTSVVIAVAAAHRSDALAACKDAIDTLKVTVPLWKKEIYEGGEEWIGQGS
jgi:molybdopterin synthase catalytic subunit